MTKTLTVAIVAALFAVSCASNRAPRKPSAAPADAAQKAEVQPAKPKPSRVETRKFWTLPNDGWMALVPKSKDTLPKGMPAMMFVNPDARASIRVFEFQTEDGSTVLLAESMRQSLRKNGYTVGDLESTDAMPGQPSLFVYTKVDDDGSTRAGQVLAMRLHENPEVYIVFAAAWPEEATVEMTGDLYSIAQHFQIRVGQEPDPAPSEPPKHKQPKGMTASAYEEEKQ